MSPYLRQSEPLEPVDIESELDKAIDQCNRNLARCWALIEAIANEEPAPQ